MKISKKVKIFSIIAVVFIGLYALFGFFLTPYLVKNYLPKKLNQELNINTSFEEVKFNPFTFKLDLKTPTLFDNKKNPLFQTKEFHTQLNISKIFSKIIDFEDVNFVEPKLFATVEKNGKSNFPILSDNNSSLENNRSTKSSWNFLIKNLQIQSGYISFTDKRGDKPIVFELKPINYQAKNISSLRGEKSPQTLITQSKTANHVSISTDLILNPLNATGNIDIKGLKVDEIWNYGIGKGQIYPKGSIADISLKYRTDTTQNNDFHALIDDIKISIKNTQIIDTTTKRAAIKQISFDDFKVEANITQNSNLLTLSNGNIKLSKINLYEANQTSFIDTLHVNNFLLSYDLKNLLKSGISSLNIQGVKLENPHFSGKFESFLLNDINIKSSLDTNKSLVFSSKEFKLQNGQFLKPNLLDTSLNNIDMQNLSFTYNLKDKFQSTINTFSIQNADINLLGNLSPYETKFNSLKLRHIALNTLFDTNSSFQISLEDMELKHSTLSNKNLQNPPLQIDDIALHNFKLKDKNLQLNSLQISNAELLTSLEKDGSLDFLQGMTTQEKTKTNEQTNGDFNYDIQNTNLDNINIQFHDKTLKKPFTQLATIVDTKISNISSNAQKSANFSLNAAAPNIKSLAIKGNFSQNPLHVKGNLSLENSDLAPFQSYIQEYTNLILKNGFLSAKGEFVFQKDKKLQLKLNNDIELANINIQKSDNSDFTSWSNLKIKGFNYQLDKQKLHIQETLLIDPKVALLINKNGSTNFQDLTPNSKKTTQEKSPFTLDVDKFNIQNGAVEINNDSLISKGLTNVSKIKVIAEDFSTSSNKLLKTKASATINSSGYFAFNSALNIENLKKDTQFDIILKGVPLASLSSYTKNYLGYDMKKGTLTSNITQRISNGKLLGENKIGLNQIELGDTVKSENAINVPLDAALLLLKDSSGNVELDIPVSGDLNDPNFSYASVVIKAFTNIITGIVTAPFSILGNLLGVDGEKLQTVDFEPSSINIVASEEAKMKQYAQILKQKPALKLTITSAYDSNVDFQKASLDLNETKENKAPQKVDKSMFIDLANKRALAIQSSLIKEGIDKSRVIIKPIVSKDSKQGLWIQCQIGIEQ